MPSAAVAPAKTSVPSATITLTETTRRAQESANVPATAPAPRHPSSIPYSNAPSPSPARATSGIEAYSALALYLLVFFGSLAAGAAAWGAAAERAGLPATLLAASAALVVGLAATPLFPLRGGEALDLNPSLHWSEPTFVHEPPPDDGPVLVTVEYFIDPERFYEFARAMRESKRIARRDGATSWGLFMDPARPGRYLETFLVESWGEHMRQHARVTNEDRSVHELLRSFHIGDAPPVVSHLIAER